VLLNRLLLVMSVLLLTSCGFQLRGTNLSERLEGDITYRLVRGQDLGPSYADFQRVLKNTLARAGYREASPAELTLQMQSFQRENIDGAVDADLRVAEQISASTLSFSVLNSEGAVLADELRLEMRQIFRVDRTQLLGSFEQRSSVEQSLDQKLADQVVRALGVVMRGDRSAKTDAERTSRMAELEIMIERDAA
jgi:outer membrane lipopolysaccharide assembly protein LptE/RlpB